MGAPIDPPYTAGSARRAGGDEEEAVTPASWASLSGC